MMRNPQLVRMSHYPQHETSKRGHGIPSRDIARGLRCQARKRNGQSLVLERVWTMRTPAGGFPQHMERRRTDAPTEHVTRITWMLVTLLSFGALEYAAYNDRFGRSQRQFQRDAYKLRDIGRTAGFTVSPRTSGRIVLQKNTTRFDWLASKTSDVAATLRRIAEALGGPVAMEMREGIGEGVIEARRGFLHLRVVQPRKGTHTADVFSFL